MYPSVYAQQGADASFERDCHPITTGITWFLVWFCFHLYNEEFPLASILIKGWIGRCGQDVLFATCCWWSALQKPPQTQNWGERNSRWNWGKEQKSLLNGFATGEILTQTPDLRYLTPQKMQAYSFSVPQVHYFPCIVKRPFLPKPTVTGLH